MSSLDRERESLRDQPCPLEDINLVTQGFSSSNSLMSLWSFTTPIHAIHGRSSMRRNLSADDIDRRFRHAIAHAKALLRRCWFACEPKTRLCKREMKK